MSRSRGTEMPQRQSPRGPPKLRTSSSDSDPLHHRPITDRSPKLGDRRSPRSQSESVNQKKLGTRIADLESQLGQAQEELKNLKEQLVSAEAAKKEAQEELEKKAKMTVAPVKLKIKDKHYSRPTEIPNSNEKDRNAECDNPDENQQETDVYEVPIEKVAVEEKAVFNQELLKSKPDSVPSESPPPSEPVVPLIDELSVKNDEINSLKAKLEVKEKELEEFCQANENLKSQLNEATSKIASAQVKEEEMSLKLRQLGQEMVESKGNVVQLNQKLKSMEESKEALETEMKKLRVQTEQWRKAADAAAAVLAGGAEMNNGRRISERCGSMDKHFGSIFEPPVVGYAGFVGSPGFDDSDDGFGTGKRKGSGIRMFGDLWKKKGQK